MFSFRDSCGKQLNGKLTGSFGKCYDPIVKFDDHEYVCTPCFIDPDTNEVISTVCQSKNCCKCGIRTDSCRFGKYKDLPRDYVALSLTAESKIGETERDW